MPQNIITGKRIFITGGAGFIGSWFIEKVIDTNKVIVYDNGHRNALKFTGLDRHPNLVFVKGDILDRDKLVQSIPEDCDYVFHMAAIAGVPTVVKHPMTTLRVNLIGTINCLEAIKTCKNLKRLVFFSTSEVYGPFIFKADEMGMTTQGPIGEPRWIYAVSKLASEHILYSYYVEYGVPVVSIRPFNIYGPRQVGEGAVHHFANSAIENSDIEVHSDGSAIRSWCYVEDMVDAMMRVVSQDVAIGQVFNIGNPYATSTILELARKIVFLSGSKSEIRFKTISYPDVEMRVPSIEKAKKLLGYKPRVDYEEGLKRTIDWYRANREKVETQ
jgi:nucleoside-diphosphate-sugar epimerase